MPLYIVSTPIGNLEDITLRALRILRESELILAEDTRITRRLLNHYEIDARMISYHAHNEMKRIPAVLELLAQERPVALVSDAGTPLISDPGHRLVKAVISDGFTIIPIPGSSAILAALVASGMPTDRFVFEGFIPRKKGRKTRLEFLAQEPGTLVVYESANRVQKTIRDIVNIMGNRYIVISREITKRFEEFIRGEALQLLDLLEDRTLKGEVVLLIGGTGFRMLEQSQSEYK